MRSLADGHEKIAVLTTKPVDPANPTVTELAAGIDASCAVLASDWNFGPTDSDTFSEPAVCEDSNAQSYGRSNGQFGATIFRHFATATPGEADATADTTFAAVKVKGTTVWVYSRLTAKKSAEAWAEDDEIRYGAEVLTDTPQPPQESGGYVKARVPGQVQKSWPYIKAAPATP
ncbi:hypothetical protein GUY44_07150 [Pimelobacter simplex]|uniref:Uncharacterized protein n=1 Tax=Nocardioides simplex TaxID=2045 RepID=A0A0A1DKA3_NOCSI|nr:hypothetical protein [Pimelobacter simplex]AIY17784.1 hypothetical protein KR76_15255 [Pimelobacter simplex]MCG8150249.1 hypothetical protein [Pimelobacter simplex]UUW88468.1 hypothetical protein M0M43_22375 [Pimelobacter simplex]UUW97972.1 hypothetical protein M0M48_11020 [Pimelobacter simplex]SFM71954.1 hypothetical protein SAMN05421671_3130 [Pimelobacter simplex]